MVLLLQPKAHYKNTIGQPQVLTFHITYGAAAPVQGPVQQHYRPVPGTYIPHAIMVLMLQLKAQYKNTVALPKVLTFHMTYGVVATAQGPVQEHNRPAPGTFIP